MDWPDDFINKVICGDCLEIMKEIPDKAVDLVLTDPPYLGLSKGVEFTSRHGVVKSKNKSKTVGDLWDANLDWTEQVKRIAKFGVVAFCNWSFVGEIKKALGGHPVALVTWYKRNSMPSLRNRPRYSCEYIWLIKYEVGISWRRFETFYDIPTLPAGCMAMERFLQKDSGISAHPTQKPLGLICELIKAGSDEGDIILDPFLGSGTLAEACGLLHRNFIGIEINSDYCKIAEDRLRQRVL